MTTGAKTEPEWETHTFDGILFDLDGTIVDSTEAIIKHWHKVGKELGVDPAEILKNSHGRRSIDTLQLYDPTLANWEHVSKIEGAIPVLFGDSATLVPGASAILSSLTSSSSPWGIVTSGTRALAIGWLDRLQLAHPEHLVVAENVAHGKPDPACYLLGRKRLGVEERGKRILVLEDAPAGIRAGKAAGCEVVALLTTHEEAQVQGAGADWVVKDLSMVRFVEKTSEGIVIQIRGRRLQG